MAEISGHLVSSKRETAVPGPEPGAAPPRKMPRGVGFGRSPGAPVNDFDPAETPDLPNIQGGPPPAPPKRYLAPADLYIDRPDIAPGARTFIVAGYEIRPDLLGYEMRSAATGRRVKPRRA